MSNTFWSSLSKYDKWKLIYAYVALPIWMVLSTSGAMYYGVLSEYISTYGSNAVANASFKTGFVLSIVVYFIVILPPTLIRFLYFGRGLCYGLEIYYSIILSIAISLLVLSGITGVVSFGFGVSIALALYCILSYRSTGVNIATKSQRYFLTCLTIAIPFILTVTFEQNPAKIRRGRFPLINEAIFLCYVINSHLPSGKDKSSGTSAPPNNEAPPSGQDHTRDASGNYTSGYTRAEYAYTEAPPSGKAVKLVQVSLSLIGRKTRQQNPYITPESERLRHKVEYPFLRRLAEKYTDAGARKVLAKHFMMYKATCLFITFGVLLKPNPALHSEVKNELKVRLSDGLSADGIKERDEYIYVFMKRFYAEYQRSKNIERALNYMFWKIAAEKYPEVVKLTDLSQMQGSTGLLTIYKHSHSVLCQILHTL